MAQEILDRESEEAYNIIMWAEDAGLEPRFNYSGRGMYGKTCFGLVGNIDGLKDFFFKVGYECANEETEANNTTDENFVAVNYMNYFKRMSTDSMCMDSIFYFPSFNITENETEN